MKHWHWGDDLDELRATLDRGGLLVIPTESSYGLGVDPRNERGVESVYRVKARERSFPLPVVAADLEQLADLAVDLDGPGARACMAHWPAPLTLVLPCEVPHPAAAGSGSLAVRIPEHERLRGLLSMLGTGLTATSANRSGLFPVLDPEELDCWLGDELVVVVDDGVLEGGRPSTLIRPKQDGQWSLLREGRFPVEKISV